MEYVMEAAVVSADSVSDLTTCRSLTFKKTRWKEIKSVSVNYGIAIVFIDSFDKTRQNAYFSMERIAFLESWN